MLSGLYHSAALTASPTGRITNSRQTVLLSNTAFSQTFSCQRVADDEDFNYKLLPADVAPGARGVLLATALKGFAFLLQIVAKIRIPLVRSNYFAGLLLGRVAGKQMRFWSPRDKAAFCSGNSSLRQAGNTGAQCIMYRKVPLRQ